MMKERPLVTVGGLIVAPDGDIFLVRSKKWHDLYSLPGGKVEWGETREEAFRREVEEETGLAICHIRFAIVQDCIFSPEFWEHRHFVMNDFIADLDPACSKDQVKLNAEAYDYRWINPEKALSLSLHRECRHLIEWYLTHGKRTSQEGIIGVENHHIRCLIGVLPEEKIAEQDLYIDLKVRSDFAACVKEDDVQKTIDYVALANLCTRLVKSKHYHLIETLASDILDQCLRTFNISWAWVRIKKPAAVPSANYAFVEYERTR